MRRAVERVERLLARRRRLVLAAWGALLVAALPLFARQDENLTAGGYTVPGSQSEAVELASERIPGAEPYPLAVVVRPRAGADARAAIARVRVAAGAVDGLAAQPPPSTGAAGVAIVPVRTPADQDRAIDAAVELRERLDETKAGPAARAEYLLAGQPALWAGIQRRSQESLVAAEAVGFPIVFLILLATFGSLAAALLPLGLGFASVALTGAVVHLLSRELDMSLFVTNIASLVGIGVAVDYSLFVLARYREELAAGAAPAEARRTAMQTSGVAVVASGSAVAASLAGLFLIDAPTLRSLALGAIVVVAFAVLGAVALLPALLGRRAAERGRLAALLDRLAERRRARRGARPDVWQRWTERVTRRPALSALAAAAVLVVLAAPALSLETGVGALRQLHADDPERRGTEIAAAALGPGALAPIDLLVGGEGPLERRALDDYARRLRADPGIARVEGPHLARDASAAILSAISRADPESDAAVELLERLRAGEHRPPSLAAADVAVGGATAQNEDFRLLVLDSLPLVLLFVAAISYAVLLVLLRSLVLPLKAVLVNLLTVGAGYGVVVAVFQWGLLDGVTGYESAGYVNEITPAFVLPIVFGLSMDYEVFLLARIRERREATGDTRRAVAEGLRASAATITSAAAVMVAVFLTFVAVSVPSVKELGVGLAVAIALDATLVRLVLVPAAMVLMGRWNWWLPRPLERLLPGGAPPAAEANGGGGLREGRPPG